MFIRRRASNLVSYSAVLTLLGLGAAQATTFSTPTGKLGTSQSYGDIIAYGFTAKLAGPTSGNLLAQNLFGEMGTGSETGLGLAGTSSNEINAPPGSQAIVLDVTKLKGQDFIIGFGSVQVGEGWTVGFSSSSELPTNENQFENYQSGNVNYPKTFDLDVVTSNYLIVEATKGNVLLTSLNATTSTKATAIPEPASMALLGAGLASVGLISRRSKVQA